MSNDTYVMPAVTLTVKPGRLVMHLDGRGTFVAIKSDVDQKLRERTKAQLVKDGRAYWPELFTTAQLRAMPAYEIAIMLVQL